MTRDIKFRAWDGKKMRDNFFIQADGTKNRDVWSWEIMQYTGLKDKNGVEIYEGDVVVRMSGGIMGDGKPLFTGVVRFWDNGFAAAYSRTHKPGTSFEETVEHHGRISNSGELEVIGNIYENPELLATA